MLCFQTLRLESTGLICLLTNCYNINQDPSRNHSISRNISIFIWPHKTVLVSAKLESSVLECVY